MNALSPALAHVVSPILLVFSNRFMTYAWYGHLRNLRTAPLWVAIAVGWGVAFFKFRGVRVPA